MPSGYSEQTIIYICMQAGYAGRISNKHVQLYRLCPDPQGNIHQINIVDLMNIYQQARKLNFYG